MKLLEIALKVTIGYFLFLVVFAILIVTGIIPPSTEVENTVGALIFLSIIPLAIVFKIGPKGKMGRRVKRRAFTQDTKDLVLSRQNYRCNLCGVTPQHWNFDHIGSRGNNSPSNCQALCLDCHADKTKRENRQSKRR